MIVLRTYAHETITEMAEIAACPVINALSDLEHPCQALADFMTVEERFGSAKGLKFTYVGDGNNVCHSLMLMARAAWRALHDRVAKELRSEGRYGGPGTGNCQRDVEAALSWLAIR